jgi:hypothetical protein
MPLRCSLAIGHCPSAAFSSSISRVTMMDGAGKFGCFRHFRPHSARWVLWMAVNLGKLFFFLSFQPFSFSCQIIPFYGSWVSGELFFNGDEIGFSFLPLIKVK